ncbi:MAG: hypothetical protein CR982_06725 [Candidatus Cloacimonadota bacterium]|nr:MAG: hypothetical protein CR982_06725 [Candidatus Cloacimonadota bacterium]PIE77823.1 MAG: hypothetical protein CSA15_11040 [Candidatus Delongbacteria bacterium]
MKKDFRVKLLILFLLVLISTPLFSIDKNFQNSGLLAEKINLFNSNVTKFETKDSTTIFDSANNTKNYLFLILSPYICLG